MSGFVPSYPKPQARKNGTLRRFFETRRCGIRGLWERSYTMRAGEVWSPRGKYMILNEPAAVRRMLTADAEQFPKSRAMGVTLGLLIGDSIFVSRGATWRRQRRMMEPAFEMARIGAVFPQMLDAARDMEARIAAQVAGGERTLDIEIETTHVAADIIIRTLMSRPFSRADAEVVLTAFTAFQETAYAYGIARMAGIPDLLLILHRNRAARQARTIRVILDAMVEERYAAAQRGEPAPAEDIIAALIEARDPADGTPFSFQELAEQISMLFLAGHETSAAAMAWSLYLMAADPEVQERMHAEAVAALGDREPTTADMKKLPFTRDVFREAMRLYPPVSFLLRDAECPAHVQGKDLKTGNTVIISPWLMHRHRRLWERPDQFDPDRFETEAGRESARNAYLPFSQGQRVCIGAAFALQEATLVLALLARRFAFALEPGHTPQPAARLTLRSDNGIRLRVRERAPAAAGGAAAG